MGSKKAEPPGGGRPSHPMGTAAHSPNMSCRRPRSVCPSLLNWDGSGLGPAGSVVSRSASHMLCRHAKT